MANHAPSRDSRRIHGVSDKLNAPPVKPKANTVAALQSRVVLVLPFQPAQATQRAVQSGLVAGTGDCDKRGDRWETQVNALWANIPTWGLHAPDGTHVYIFEVSDTTRPPTFPLLDRMRYILNENFNLSFGIVSSMHLSKYSDFGRSTDRASALQLILLRDRIGISHGDF